MLRSIMKYLQVQDYWDVDADANKIILGLSV